MKCLIIIASGSEIAPPPPPPPRVEPPRRPGTIKGIHLRGVVKHIMAIRIKCDKLPHICHIITTTQCHQCHQGSSAAASIAERGSVSTSTVRAAFALFLIFPRWSSLVDTSSHSWWRGHQASTMYRLHLGPHWVWIDQGRTGKRVVNEWRTKRMECLSPLCYTYHNHDVIGCHAVEPLLLLASP